MSDAIRAGIFNDLGSGSNVDVCVITKVCIFSLLIELQPYRAKPWSESIAKDQINMCLLGFNFIA